jgi:hypothetical protein
VQCIDPPETASPIENIHPIIIAVKHSSGALLSVEFGFFEDNIAFLCSGGDGRIGMGRKRGI